MTTTKQRINITADSYVQKSLKFLAKRDKMPVSAKALGLLRLALELEEDMIWAKIADERVSDKGPVFDHESAWK